MILGDINFELKKNYLKFIFVKKKNNPEKKFPKFNKLKCIEFFVFS